MMRRLVLNSISLSAGFALAQGLTAVAYWITARNLDPSQFGEVAAYVGIAMLLVAAGDFGFNAWVIRELAQSGSGQTFATSLGVRSAVATSVGGAWIVVTAAMALGGFTPSYVPALGVWIAFALLWNTLLAPFQAGERMHQVAAVTATERLVLVAVVGIGVIIGDPAGALVIGLAMGAVLATVLAVTLIEAQMRRVNRPTIRQIGSALRASFGFAMSSLALQAQRLDVAIVGLTAGSFNAGIYAAPARLTNALGILPTAFATSLFPNAAKRRGPLWTRDFVGSLAGLLLVMTVLLTPLFVFAPTLAATLLGHEYESSGDVLRVILVGMLFATLNHPIAIAYQARGLEHFVAKTIAIGSAFGLGAIALGAATVGATGAAVGFVVLQAVSLGVLLVRPRLLRADAKADKSLPSHAHL